MTSNPPMIVHCFCRQETGRVQYWREGPPISLAGSLIWMLPVMTPPPVESAGLYSPPPLSGSFPAGWRLRAEQGRRPGGRCRRAFVFGDGDNAQSARTISKGF